MDEPRYLETNELREAVLDLATAREHLDRVRDEPHEWKWALIALHSSLQGFMVCALQGSNGLNTLDKRSATAWLAWHEAGDYKQPSPDERLADFMTLFKRVTKPAIMKFYTHSQQLNPTEKQRRSVRYLNSVRRRFAHFTPMGWLLSVTELPDLVTDILDVIEFLAFRTGNIAWHYDDDLPDLLKEELAKLRRSTLPEPPAPADA